MTEITTTTVETEETVTPYETLVELRLRLGLSRRETADLSGLTQSRVWRLEHLDADGDVDETQVKDRMKLYDALTEYETEHPEGKPVKTPKTRKNKVAATSTPDEAAALEFALQSLRTYIDVTLPAIIAGYKASKVGTKVLVTLLTDLTAAYDTTGQIARGEKK